MSVVRPNTTWAWATAAPPLPRLFGAAWRARRQVRTISYGKDRPVCTDATEACYQRNRRAHLAPGQYVGA